MCVCVVRARVCFDGVPQWSWGKKMRPAPLCVHMSHSVREETAAVRDVTQRLPRFRVPQSGVPDASRQQVGAASCKRG